MSLNDPQKMQITTIILVYSHSFANIILKITPGGLVFGGREIGVRKQLFLIISIYHNSQTATKSPETIPPILQRLEVATEIVTV